MNGRTPLPRRVAWAAVCLLWLGAVAAGLAWLADYSNRPGAAAHPGGEWPTESALTRDRGRMTLVMLAHPRCDCTKASVAELAEVIARAERQPRLYVVFIKPGGLPGDWEKTDLWRSAARIPGATIVRDDDGVEAQRFGAQTSGQVFLYDTDGRLVFSGGDTGSRGHAGENEGRLAILARLNGRDRFPKATPVFGCSLFASPEELQAQEARNHAPHRD